MGVLRGVALTLLGARFRRGEHQCQRMLFSPHEQPSPEDPPGQFAGVGDETVERDAVDQVGDIGLSQAGVATGVGEARGFGERGERTGQIRQVDRHDMRGYPPPRVVTRTVWRPGAAGRDRVVKNIWKGLMFGAFVGAAIGLILDILQNGQQKAGEAGARLKGRAHEAVESLGDATHRASDWVREQDVPGKVRTTVEDLASSAPAERIRQAVERD
jgi:hypothetical protein